MRFVPLICAFWALATASQAQTTNWKVDPANYSSAIAVGHLQITPTIKMVPREYQYAVDPSYRFDTVEVGLRASPEEHPRLMFVGRYLYRRLKKEDEKKDLLNYQLPPFAGMHGNGVSAGFSCKLPLTTCFTHR